MSEILSFCKFCRKPPPVNPVILSKNPNQSGSSIFPFPPPYLRAHRVTVVRPLLLSLLLSIAAHGAQPDFMGTRIDRDFEIKDLTIPLQVSSESPQSLQIACGRVHLESKKLGLFRIGPMPQLVMEDMAILQRVGGCSRFSNKSARRYGVEPALRAFVVNPWLLEAVADLDDLLIYELESLFQSGLFGEIPFCRFNSLLQVFLLNLQFSQSFFGGLAQLAISIVAGDLTTSIAVIDLSISGWWRWESGQVDAGQAFA